MAVRQGQSNAMLNSLITFVVLFIVATVAAIICYVKLDEARKIADNETRTRRELASDSEASRAAAIVGAKDSSMSHFGAILNGYNALYSTVTGRLPEEGKSIESANEEIGMAITNFKNSFEGGQFADAAILPMAMAMKSEYDAAKSQAVRLAADVEAMQEKWNRDVAGFSAAEEKIVGEKNMFIAQATAVQESVEQMKNVAAESVQRRIDQLQQQIDTKNAEIESCKQQSAELAASLKEADMSRNKLETQLEQIKPRPDIEVAAYKPDGKIVSVDLKLGIVYLDLGSNDHVYRGLTFAVYDRSAPMPEDGKGKAEIRVFDVRSEVSVARIVSQNERNPIIPDDIIVNLIWDKKSPNTFIVVGEFDLDGDGNIDLYGRDKVVSLINSWGGIVTETLDINTDFVVLGAQPELTVRPSEAQIAVDPMAMDRYNKAIEIANQYRAVMEKAAGLSIPVFNTERFKNLIGYNAEAKGDRPF